MDKIFDRTFLSAIRNKDVRWVRKMIEEEGANVINWVLHEGDEGTPLHVAAGMSDNVTMVQLLLKNGADVSLKNIMQRTPLHCAACYTVDTDVCHLLLKNGANGNDKDVFGDTPFQQVLRSGSLDTVKLFLQYGANMRTVNNTNETALHSAAGNRPHPDVLEFILDKEFDLELSDNDGYSALHHAAVSGNAEGCELLLKHGAKVDKKTVTDETPLVLAIDSPCATRDVVQILLEYGADLADKFDDMSPLELAVLVNDGFWVLGIVKILLQHMAKMQCVPTRASLGDFRHLSISKEDQKVIERYANCNKHYQSCLQEIDSMRKATFYNRTSIFDILTGSTKEISAYSRNKELVKAFEENTYDVHQFPIYLTSLQRRLYNEVERQGMRDEAATILSDTFTFTDPFHPVIRMIISYLADKDLKFLGI